MEKAMYPSKIIRITQKDHIGTHEACWAVDEAAKDGGIGDIIAPFTGIIRKVYPADANEVWLESKNPVQYADGTIDYMTILFCHANDISNLYVDKEIKQGEVFYREGTKGQATGNHLHFECGKGKFTGSGWYKDAAGAWSIINGKKVDECLWIDDSYTIMNAASYNFKKVISKFGIPVARNEKVNQIKINDDATIVRARKTPNGDVLGHMNTGIYNSLEVVNKDGYNWHKVENNLWFAHSNDWSEVLPKKEESKVPTIEELQAEITKLNKELTKAEKQVKSLIKELDELKASQPKFIFESPKLDYYAIKLNEKDNLYIGK